MGVYGVPLIGICMKLEITPRMCIISAQMEQKVTQSEQFIDTKGFYG